MKLGKRFTALILALVMVFSLTVTASAAAAETVTVKLSPNITVTLDGEAQAMADVNGNPVYPVLYGGTTYLPVRAVGNMLGLGVDWDQATQTVLLTTSDSNTTGGTTGSKAPADAKPTDITVSINPSITVKLDGETQKMTNVNGEPVYPMLYGGTTYLPVRAVSNMLGLEVDWDGTTQTVILIDPITRIALTDENGNRVVIDLADKDAAMDALKTLGWADEFIDRAINGPHDSKSIDDLFTDVMRSKNPPPTTSTEPANPLDGMQTSENVKQLGDMHIGYYWGEIDWSTASKGYVRIKLDNKIAKTTSCTAEWYNETNCDGGSQILTINGSRTDGWFNLPLWQSNDEYECVVTIKMHSFTEEFYNTDESYVSDTLRVRFTAKLDNPDSVLLLSHAKADYENAPSTVAKAKELTQNCKTDAEKITVIYNFVSTALAYDNALIAQEAALKAAGKQLVGADRNLNPDSILASKKGVCEHYAVLMTAMLRSVGVPCKYVEGQMNANGKWGDHAWVAVKPETGTLNIPGMGKDYAGVYYDENGSAPADPTGWIRLDPTNANHPAATSNDNNYRTEHYC